MPRLIDGSKFTTIGVTPGTGATILYTVPANHAAVVRHLSISNNNAAAKKITAQFYDSSASAYVCSISFQAFRRGFILVNAVRLFAIRIGEFRKPKGLL